MLPAGPQRRRPPHDQKCCSFETAFEQCIQHWGRIRPESLPDSTLDLAEILLEDVPEDGLVAYPEISVAPNEPEETTAAWM